MGVAELLDEVLNFMHIVYVLLSQKDPQRYYIGLTDDLPRRLIEHNSAFAGYSTGMRHGALKLILLLKIGI